MSNVTPIRPGIEVGQQGGEPPVVEPDPQDEFSLAGYLMHNAVRAAILLLDHESDFADAREIATDVLRLARDRWEQADSLTESTA